MSWVLNNKEWIFSGIGVFTLGLLITIFQKSTKSKSIKQSQKSGSNSTNIQIGGDLKK
ncbi:hypothetical protein SAMN05192574_11051 [Mucilaginibacter gossypiicola]|uniref:Uncharacterized protein n=1 Tax=Mucilaginibacter gossypiicola TaxID=551995 RepID=A0A1H8R9X0_9SPHI|nr:hypothetical protein [Mucilaginibacter gossypiicola]SEO63201.1 hypothetical protein SAMN05192574_11051 [Mucilaginibacter gossypiicola]